MNATELWSELRHSTERRFDEYIGTPEAEPRAEVQKRLLLALELRWKLEEQLLLPALAGCGELQRTNAREAGEEIEHLRDLAALVGSGELSPASNLVVMGALEGIADLRSAELERWLTTACTIDDDTLAREMQALLKRWRGEVRETGAVEDEERDPVGTPPR